MCLVHVCALSFKNSLNPDSSIELFPLLTPPLNINKTQNILLFGFFALNIILNTP